MSKMESPILQTNHQQKENDRENILVDTSLTVNSNLLGETTTFTTTSIIHLTDVTDIEKEDPEDLVILRKDPTTRRNLINKSAYAKLHRTLSPGRNSTTIDNLKEKYETNNKPDLIDVKSQAKEDTETAQKKRTPPVNLDEETLQSLKNKYSPSSFGYPKIAPRNSKVPVARARSNSKSQIILPSSKQPENNKLRHSLNVDRKPKSKDENSNELFRKNSSSSGEFITIITRPKSEESIDKFEKELNLFTMDEKAKEKKRSNSFRKIFSGRIFGKDKKKKEEKNKVPYKENVVYSDNLQNESAFNRQTTYRHTTGGNSNVRTKGANVSRSGSGKSQEKPVYITKEMEEQYAQMHVDQFNHIKQAFEHPTPGVSPTETVPPVQPTGYVRMDKPLVKNNPGPISYVAMPNVKKFIDTSSSASTPESERSNIYQNELFTKANRDEPETKNENTLRSIWFNENNKDSPRDTPPRAQELRQDVTLVNPKALIPINSERPLPNPYQNSNSSTLDKPKVPTKPSVSDNMQREQSKSQPRLEETYGTVFDSLDNDRGRNRPVQRPSSNSSLPKGLQKPPRSPSLEPSKLKLPPNREIVPLSPRVQSPIPHDNVSTDKIIATELLKSAAKSPTAQRRSTSKLSSPSHQKLEIDIDYPDNINNERNEKSLEKNIYVSSKPPVSKIPMRRSPEASSSSANSLSRQRISQNSPAFDSKRLSQSSPASENMENIYARYRRSQASPVVENQERITTNAMVHVNSPNARTPTPNQVLYNRSLSPVTPQSARSSTPMEPLPSPAKSSPQKEDMRKSVEAYYWKELKKLKEQENLDLYVYQMQMMPYGYAEDPIIIRKSRSMSPTTQRSSRRSLSLPRDPRPANVVKDSPENIYGRMQHASIPEDRVVMNQRVPQRNVLYEQQYAPQFRRSAPERRTLDGSPRSYENYNNSLYRPIFKRGSLTTPVKGPMEDPQNKRVSFSSSRADTQSLQSWPTKNGFTQSPPQRRMENNRGNNLDDDVFLPNGPRGYDENGIYGYTIKPPNLRPEYTNEDIYYNSRQNMMLKKEPVYDPDPQVRYRQINMQEYVQTPEDSLYGQPIDAVKPPPYGLTRHGSIQMREPLYEQRIVARRMSYDNVQPQRRIQEPQYVNRQNQIDPRYGMKREIIVKDEIFGQFGGYIPQNEERYLINRQLQNPVYSSRQSVAESVSPRIGPRQVSVRNKVCDIYGQIHDREQSPGQIRKTGVILGQLQSNPGSPQVVRHVPNEQFVRNSRLTASANDMYRRYQSADPRYRSDVVYDRYPYPELEAPTRPLPPVPMDKKLLLRNNSGRSDVDSASDAEAVNSSAKNKKRSFFGK